MSVTMSDRCRLCARSAKSGRACTGKMIKIFPGEASRNNIAHKIKRSLPFRVKENDGLPQQVCPNCLTKLDMCYSFVKDCVEARSILEKFYSNGKPQSEVTTNKDKTKDKKSKPKDKESNKSKDKDSKSKDKDSRSRDKESKSKEKESKSKEKELKSTDKTSKSKDKELKSKEKEAKSKEKKRSESVEESKKHKLKSKSASDDKMIVDDNVVAGSSRQNGNVDMDQQESSTADKHDNTTKKSKDEIPTKFDINIVALFPECKKKEDGEQNKSLIVLVKIDENEECSRIRRTEIATEVYTNSTVKHSKSHLDVSCFPCNPCSKGYPSKKALMEHFRLRHPADHQLLHCTECRDVVCVPPEIIQTRDKEHKADHHVENTEASTKLVRRFSNYLNTAVELLKTRSTGVVHLASYNDLHKKFILTKISPKDTYRYEPESVTNVNDTSGVKTIQFQCGFCHFTFISNEHFTKHMLTIHFGQKKSVVKVFPCSQCEQKFPSELLLRNHLDGHSPSKDAYVVCEECGKLILKHKLTTHRDYSHITKECQYCHQMLLKHAWRRHNEKKGENLACKAAQNGIVHSIYKGSQANLYQCKYCKERFVKKSCAYHYAYHKVFEKCPSSIPQVDLRYLHNKEFQKAYDYAINEKWNKKKMKILKMKEEGTLNKKVKCHICNKMYSHTYISSHRRTHSKVKDLECDMCAIKFHNKGDIAKHMRTKHLKLLPQCQYCSKPFPSHKLASHEAIHRGERNFKCPHCPKSFSGVYNMRAHVRAIHILNYYSEKKKKQRMLLRERFSKNKGKS